MRTYVNLTYETNSETIQQIQALSKPDISVEDYRHSFYLVGEALGKLLNERTHGEYGNTMLACASEDADWLARGVLKSLSQKEVSLAVFWNERITLNVSTGLEYSPIIKSYIEPINKCRTLVVVKSAEENIETGLKKFGAMLGDCVEVGCNSVLNPGTVIGRHTNVYPLSRVRGFIPENSIFKDQEHIVLKEDRG